MTSLSVKPTTRSNEINPKKQPNLVKCDKRLISSYAASKDGYDSNLLIFLHGLGDTQLPFFKLGQSLSLPQTAVLSIRAPLRIPLLDEDAFQWYPSFDEFGEIISNPNPTSTLDILENVCKHLIQVCGWPQEAIHIFGFAQGGSVTAELALRLARQSPQTNLGSVVSVSGPLLSFPSASSGQQSKTPTLLWCRPTDGKQMATAYQKGFANIESLRVLSGEGMPRNQSEWQGIMKFWSQRLRRLQPWELGNGDDADKVYEVTSTS